MQRINNQRKLAAFSEKISASVTVDNLLNVLPKWNLKLTGSSSDPDYADAVATLNDPSAKSLLEEFLEFSGRYKILAYNGSQFSQLGTAFQASLTFKFKKYYDLKNRCGLTRPIFFE